MEVVEVVFETHSTSEDNERGIATGWLGGKLSAEGRAQAGQLGSRRRSDGVDVVVCSDLNRAVETARIAFCGFGIPVFLDWRLRECNYGAMNGMPRAQLEAERGRRLDDPFPDGESWRGAVARVVTCLQELATKRGGQRVLLIGQLRRGGRSTTTSSPCLSSGWWPLHTIGSRAGNTRSTPAAGK